MTTHSNVLAWRIIWTEKPGRLQSMGSHKIGHDWSNLVVVVVYCDKLPSYPNFDFELFCTWIVTAATAHFCSQLRDVLKVLVTQSCQTLCNPMDCSPPGSPVHRILQARILEWVAISFSWGSSPPRDQTHISCITSRFFTVWATREAREGYIGLLNN